ncbi:hypothetical protein AcW1_007547 [Taiwanofungus camphoratus]|nr:hypothetical protein AcW2_007397 [Antrodia cinnamomea]KAI0927109.1 hypothetical protein AcV5_007732 [Antrodia cinnamomea]KAI0953292.1 hypothetical protein AcW1_007547 [Antrodia cinnamomea]
MSTFVSHLTRDISLSVVPPTTPSSPSTVGTENLEKQSLRALFLDLNDRISISETTQCLETARLEANCSALSTPDHEVALLRRAILAKLAVRLYGHALDTFLEEARRAENELEWWSDVERSSSGVALYLVQTFPSRLATLVCIILTTIRERNIPFRLSLLTPSSLRRLFPSKGVLRPNSLTTALFPHLRVEPYSVALSAARFPSRPVFAASPRKSIESVFTAFTTALSSITHNLVAIVTLPMELTRGECRYKQKELRKIRDDRAEILGTLAEMRGLLISAIEENDQQGGMEKLNGFTSTFNFVISGENVSRNESNPNESALESLQTVSARLTTSNTSFYASEMQVRNLLRPSRLTLLWPRLFLLPPLALYLVRTVYASRASLQDMSREVFETVRAFWEGWILEPLKGVAKTVRAGGDEGIIITRESVRADLDSLERMTLALAQEKLHYDVPQMEALSRQIQLGDLTPVMQIYEEDIKSPLKSAVGGTLLRTLFIQVQKAKVDIDQALSGIDKLLKSQELTFAFVGVAPALAITYAFCGYLRNLWTGGRGKGRYGGKGRRASAWLKMRCVQHDVIR